jgi:hypothetical protein
VAVRVVGKEVSLFLDNTHIFNFQAICLTTFPFNVVLMPKNSYDATIEKVVIKLCSGGLLIVTYISFKYNSLLDSD